MMKKKKYWLFICFFALLLLICFILINNNGKLAKIYFKSLQQNMSSSVIYNLETSNLGENSDYLFCIFDLIVENNYLFLNKKTGLEGSFVRDAFQEDSVLYNAIYVIDDYLYYMQLSRDYSERGLHEGFSEFKLIELNTKTFNEKIIYKDNANGSSKKFMGLQTIENNNALFYQSINNFFISDKYIYFITSDTVWEVNRISGNKSDIIHLSNMRSLAFDGELIYYINDNLELSRYNINSKKTDVISEVVTEKFILTDGTICYINRRDHNRIYSLQLKDNIITKISDLSVSSFTCDSEYIYYTDNERYYLYRMDRDGQNIQIIVDEKVYIYYTFSSHDIVYIYSESERNYVKINVKQ